MPDGFLKFLSYLAVMAGVTYLVRLIPMIFIRKKITNRFIKSFLHYVPYSVLSVMTFPAILYSTGYLTSAIVGTLVAVLLAFRRKGLLVVAIGAALGVLIAELLITYIPLSLP